MMAIYEPPVRNSGIIGGKFLEKTRVAKPGSTIDKPVYYGPNDFKVGAIIQVGGSSIFMPRLGGAYCLRRVRSQRKSSCPFATEVS